MTPETLFALADARGQSYHQISRSSKPQWPLEAVALAMADMYPQNERERCYAAFAWRWARDKAQYPALWGGLLITTAERALRERWPRQLRGVGFYIERLIELALIEEHHWWILRKGNLYAAMMEVEEQMWQRRLSWRYEAVRHQIESWCCTTHQHMYERMKTDMPALSRASAV